MLRLAPKVCRSILIPKLTETTLPAQHEVLKQTFHSTWFVPYGVHLLMLIVLPETGCLAGL